MSRHYLIPVLCAVALAVVSAGTAMAEEIDQTTGLPVVIVPEEPLPGGDRDYEVLWDLTHGVYLQYDPSGNYSQLTSMLAGDGFNMHTTTQGVHNIDLSVYDVIVVCLGSAWNNAYTQPEIDALFDFMTFGGGIIVMGDNPGCPNANINPVAGMFGTTCGIGDCSSDVTIFESHPLFAGVDQLYCGAPGALSADGLAEEVAWASDGRLMITAAEFCGGPMVVIGDINFCANSNLGNADNAIFAMNAFNWLVSFGPSPTEAESWGAIKALYR